MVLAHAGKDVSELAVAMGALIKVHEIHVHGVPRNLLVVLGMEMEKRLAELLHSMNPHLCRREGMHPCDHTDTFLVRLGSAHYVSNFLRRVCCAFIHELYRKNA